VNLYFLVEGHRTKRYVYRDALRERVTTTGHLRSLGALLHVWDVLRGPTS